MYFTVFNGIVLDISLSVISDKCDKNLQKLLLTDKFIHSKIICTQKMKQLKVASMNYKKQKKEI